MKPESEILDEHLEFCDIPKNEFTEEMRDQYSGSLHFRMMVLGVRLDELKITIKNEISRLLHRIRN